MSKLVSFKEKTIGLDHKLLNSLRELAKKFGIETILPVPVERILVSEWVTLKCKYGCPKYNTSWCCPPTTPEPAQVRQILKEYTLALILVGSERLPGWYKKDSKTRLSQVRCWKATVSLERHLFLEGYYKAFGLVGETCVLCKECSYPAGCKFPQERRPTVESFSIDIIGTLQGLGFEPKVARDLRDPFGYFSLILLH